MNSRKNVNQQEQQSSKCTPRPISSYDNLDITLPQSSPPVTPLTNDNNSISTSNPNNNPINTYDSNINSRNTLMNESKEFQQQDSSNIVPTKGTALASTNGNVNPRFEVNSFTNNFMTPSSSSSLAQPITSTTMIAHHQQQQQSPDDNYADDGGYDNGDIVNMNSKNVGIIGGQHCKPVISDAKSKFFGINNSNTNSPNNSQAAVAAITTIPQPLSNQINNQPLSAVAAITTKGVCTKFEEDTKVNQLLLPEIRTNCKSSSITLIPSSNSSNNSCSHHHQQILTPSSNGGRKDLKLINSEKYLNNCEELTSSNQQQSLQQQHQHQQHQQNFSSSSINNINNSNFKSIPHDMDINNPSQLVYMSTTVPQNMKGNDIAGRHTPTRNSLRHSRMLVINNKNFKGPKSQNPLGLRYPYLTKILLIHHIVFGTLLTCIGFWILLWAPNTRLQDNPYWSGITLTLAGILGLIVTKFRRMKRHKIRENCFVFLKYDSYLLTLVATMLCFIALICASIHLHNLSSSTTKCTSTNILIANAACNCVFGVIESTNNNSTTDSAILNNNHYSRQEEEQEIYEFYYRDLSCSEVFGAWKFLLTVSVLFNALGFCVTILYIVSVFWRKKSKHNMYSSVRTNLF